MKPKVLIVEDDMMMRTIFELYVEQCELELVKSAGTGLEAISICEETRPNIALIDIHLKDEMDGIELSKILTEKFDIPIIFISADNDTELITNSAKKNIYGFLQKPIYKNNLKSTILFAISKHTFLSQN